MQINESLKYQISQIPRLPGIYKYFNKNDKIIYIGKAKNLKNRVGSYFNRDKNHTLKTKQLVGKIHKIEFIVTNSETEALLLENNLIKRHQPKYNVLLKDGKTYPYIVIKGEPFPRVFSSRQKIDDGSEYFGPFPGKMHVNLIIELFYTNFKLRTCKLNLSRSNIDSGKFKACLEYQIGNCEAPCVAKESNEHYDEKIQSIRKILKGKYGGLVSELKQKMLEAAENLEFEKAQSFKEKIEAFAKFKEQNVVDLGSHIGLEVITIMAESHFAVINHFKMENGAIVQTHNLYVKRSSEESKSEILAATLNHFLATEENFHQEIVTNILPDDPEEFPNLTFTIPQRGGKHHLLQLSLKNCSLALKEKLNVLAEKKTPAERIMETLQSDLDLPEMPKRIECFDNSNLQGTNPVAGLVVFINAKPAKREYRKFKIKTVEGIDDFASMKEVVFRRYKRQLDEENPLPQLIVIDGGKGQLSSATEALKELDLYGKIPIVGLAKRLEEVFFPNDSVPVYIDKTSESLRLLQNVRNEVHRFAITFHRDSRSKNTFKSELDEIPGIGKSTVKLLIKQFGSVKQVKIQSLETLESVIGKHRAGLVFKYFSNGKE